VHFVGHNLFDHDNPDLSSILLGDDDPLFPTVINGSRARFLREARPLLFFNACHSGRTDFNPMGISGWAKVLLKHGASAFVGPFWEVVDDSALVFCSKFYSELLRGAPIGEAVRLARLAIKDSGDPTWLSYSLYAHPEARVIVTAEQ
jgi:CHAT domain-containing protein